MKLTVILITGVALLSVSCAQKETGLSEKELIGKAIFFDESLSEPAGQSCATCHIPEKGFADKYARITSEGAVEGLFSNRNSMTCAYSAYVPALSYDEEEETYVGGLFWDGRVNSLEEQAAQPFVNPLEMGNKNVGDVFERRDRRIGIRISYVFMESMSLRILSFPI